MNISFKSGTNQLHGLADERYLEQNDAHRRWEEPSDSARRLQVSPDVGDA